LSFGLKNFFQEKFQHDLEKWSGLGRTTNELEKMIKKRLHLSLKKFVEYRNYIVSRITF
jgi:hypothetical protein